MCAYIYETRGSSVHRKAHLQTHQVFWKAFALQWLWAAKSPTGAVYSGTLPGDPARFFPASVSGLCAERCPGAEWPDGSDWPCSRGRPTAQCPPLINLIPGREGAGMCICCPSSAQEGLARGDSLAPSWIQGALSRFRICYNSRPRSRSLTLFDEARVTWSRDAVSLGTNFPFDIPFPLLFPSWC